jgi:hypothetical protein
MGRVIFDAGDSSKWNFLWDTTVNSASAPGGRYYPIADITIPFLLSTEVIAIYAISETARPNWKSAGFLNQKIRTGITVGGNNDGRFNGSQRVLLNQINVLNIPTTSYTPEYSLTFTVHPWHEDITLQVWEFTGVVNDSTEDIMIEEVLRRILDIQYQLEDIASYNNP